VKYLKVLSASGIQLAVIDGKSLRISSPSSSACPHGAVAEIRKGAITSNIKHAIKLKTSPARFAQLLHPSLAFCFSLQPMTAYRPGLDAVIGCKLKQNANEGCSSCASVSGLVICFIAGFILRVIAP